MKRIIIGIVCIALSLIMILPFVACSNSSDNESEITSNDLTTKKEEKPVATTEKDWTDEILDTWSWREYDNTWHMENIYTITFKKNGECEYIAERYYRHGDKNGDLANRTEYTSYWRAEKNGEITVYYKVTPNSNSLYSFDCIYTNGRLAIIEDKGKEDEKSFDATRK